MTIDPTQQLAATQRAFDSVAVNYDGALGNNILIQKMRAQVMDKIEHTYPKGARLLDLGCGTGVDATYLAAFGYDITALDSSPGMIAQTRARIERSKLKARVLHLGIHELAQLEGETFDGAYSDLGALNCLPDLRRVSNELAGKLRPGGLLIASVIGRFCPWEMVWYALHGNMNRARVRLEHGMVAVPMNGQTIWTRYYTPREFAREFAEHFKVRDLEALALFAPPPYLVHLYERAPHLFDRLSILDQKLGRKAVFRNAGDHFLIELKRK